MDNVQMKKTYNKQTDSFQVDSSIMKPALPPTLISSTVLPANRSADLTTHSRRLNEDTRFENVPLAEVLSYLSAKYQTKIK